MAKRKKRKRGLKGVIHVRGGDSRSHWLRNESNESSMALNRVAQYAKAANGFAEIGDCRMANQYAKKAKQNAAVIRDGGRKREAQKLLSRIKSCKR